MRVQIASDLHLDFHEDGGREFVRSFAVDDVDVLVLAGDIAETRSDCFLPGLRALCSSYPRVVVVAGNHEHYGSSIERVDELRATCNAIISNLSWLENDLVEIDGRRFVGSTLWFRNSESFVPRRPLNDFTFIDNFVPSITLRNLESTTFLNRTLLSDDVLVTHFLPSFKSISPKYAGSSINGCFVCDVEDLLVERQPILSIHGHTHSSCDYDIGKTRVVCNPYGYLGENPSYDGHFVVELSDRSSL